jgi:peptide/nickel transport system substrate-binding protein
MAENETPQWRRFTRLKSNRRLITRSARKIENATLKHAHTFIIRRWDNVRDVRRHAIGWLVLMGLLIVLSAAQMMLFQKAFSQSMPVPGGTYAEGVLGQLDNINPLFASSSAERSASRLLFASLLSYDRTGGLRGELASTWQMENDGKTYVVTLRDGLRWQDGAPITADDVVYTINTMKDPRAGSVLYSSWVGVSVEKRSDLVVALKLPVAYAPFPHALTFGLLPKHILGDTPPERLRESSFNRQPVGSGPFVFRNLQVIDPDQKREVLHMVANANYYNGKPKLERFQLHTYKDHDTLRRGFLTGEVNAVTDLTTDDMTQIMKMQPATRLGDAQLDNGVYALFRNDSPTLQSQAVRVALRAGVDQKSIIASLHGYANTLNGPVVGKYASSLGDIKQPGFDKKAAEAGLDAAGWVRPGPNQIRKNKDGAPLQLSVVAPRAGDYARVMEQIAKQWRDIGVDVQTELVDPTTIQQNVLVPRAYDVLIYELAVGADPDVYAYWHSSQATPRGLNLANYKSGVSDDALVSARSRSEPALREAKYHTFVTNWITDAPAVALYEPTLHYVSTQNSRTVSAETELTDAVTRYRAVEYWTVDMNGRFITP